MGWGLMNLWSKGEEGAYIVHHGSKPASDFGHPLKGKETLDERPNYFERAFPILFPHGQGGIEANRPVAVTFREHIQWTLCYHDRQFWTHESYPFVAFGILQRQEALSSARIQMRQKTFEAEARLMSIITKESLEEAQRQEEKNKPISDPAVRMLRSHVQTTSGRVIGSDAIRYHARSQLWSTTIYLTPPSLWITINPCDLHDPIAQVFAGEKIDMDAFEAAMGPNKDTRAKNIADDPYAAVKFFHFIIQAILHMLFGIQVTPYWVKSSEGIFGRLRLYFGAKDGLLAQNNTTHASSAAV
ncbi:hypothetical protein C8R41DRAFT_893157 [Lentinula lateritia]|uniref:Helitron helicase-like domain-containing protein n=1 Tax=Lentinula lateritia TaxID=40482 RepID=A0ABQ8VX58_9AGAR|nr:hypothetical protein C8R41DRAFT_893157 [Lentinula lateritia]